MSNKIQKEIKVNREAIREEGIRAVKAFSHDF